VGTARRPISGGNKFPPKPFNPPHETSCLKINRLCQPEGYRLGSFERGLRTIIAENLVKEVSLL
jgi:hypothetical protein